MKQTNSDMKLLASVVAEISKDPKYLDAHGPRQTHVNFDAKSCFGKLLP